MASLLAVWSPGAEAANKTPASVFHTPEEMVTLAYSKSRLVIMNEAHDADRHNARTRQIGIRLLPVLRRIGVKHLAMEVLYPEFAAKANRLRSVPPAQRGYLSHSDMRRLIQTALDLGFELHAYEADDNGPPATGSSFADNKRSIEYRERGQAANLARLVNSLPADERLFIWCGGTHGAKKERAGIKWMALELWRITSIEPYSIDQTPTVEYNLQSSRPRNLVARFRHDLERLGGTACILRADLLSLAGDLSQHLPVMDAYVLSVDNAMN